MSRRLKLTNKLLVSVLLWMGVAAMRAEVRGEDLFKMIGELGSASEIRIHGRLDEWMILNPTRHRQIELSTQSAAVIKGLSQLLKKTAMEGRFGTQRK